MITLECVLELKLGWQGILYRNKEPRESTHACMYVSCSKETIKLPLLWYKLDVGVCGYLEKPLEKIFSEEILEEKED